MHWLHPCVRLGWLTARVANPQPTRGRVFFLRGNGVVFSSGFGVLCRRLRAEGVWAEDLRCVGDGWLCQHVLREPGARPLVLVGHSRGGRRALAAANELEKHGIAVALVIGVDVAFPPPVPGNVLRAVHIYRSQDRIYPVRPFAAGLHLPPSPPVLRGRGIGGEGARTHIDNVDLDAANAPFPGQGIHHLNFTTNPAVQTWLYDEITATIIPREAVPGRRWD